MPRLQEAMVGKPRIEGDGTMTTRNAGLTLAICLLLAGCCEPSGRGCPDNRTAAEKTRDAKQTECFKHLKTYSEAEYKRADACMRAAGYKCNENGCR